LTRSLATQFSTLLPVTALLLFGGETLKDFAFALLVGIASGAYSSIFIASPVLTAWKEREGVYASRRRRIIEDFGMVPAYAVATAGAPAAAAAGPPSPSITPGPRARRAARSEPAIREPELPELNGEPEDQADGEPPERRTEEVQQEIHQEAALAPTPDADGAEARVTRSNREPTERRAEREARKKTSRQRARRKHGRRR
jgi:SecD/SecF fusion protein